MLLLVTSKNVYGYPRAGDSGHGFVLVSGIETIDAAGMDMRLIGYGCIMETRSVIPDMFHLLRSGQRQRAGQRSGLHGVDATTGRYRVFAQ